MLLGVSLHLRFDVQLHQWCHIVYLTRGIRLKIHLQTVEHCHRARELVAYGLIDSKRIGPQTEIGA
jgi:hypothetical protein